MADRRIAVIGKGLIGAAAARHLAEAGHHVLLIGPDEPADFSQHPGVFGSHYDAARITRTVDRDPVWAHLAQTAMTRYPDLQAGSGLRFHHPCGFLAVASGGSDLAEVLDAEAATGSPLTADPETPFMLAPGSRARLEGAPAGWVDPRRMVQAQTLCAVNAGAKVIRMPVWALRPQGSRTRVILDDGSDRLVDRVLVCAGAFSGPLGLAGDLPLHANGRVVLLAQVPDDQRAHWQDMPTMIRHDPDADLADIYLLPPVSYPDGNRYIKIGTSSIDHPLETLEALLDWFRQPPLGDDAERLAAVLHELLPELVALPLRTDACAVTLTPSGYPIIDWLETGRIAVACGGNGKAAKCADELGRLAAALLTGQDSDAELMGHFCAD